MRPKLFLGWQDSVSLRWFPVGSLYRYGSYYFFHYTKGAGRARKDSRFEPLESFPRIEVWYSFEHLFPLFSNRLPPPSRPEYREYLQWLGLPETESDPFAILARSGGRRVTDTLEVFPNPEPNKPEIHFLVEGVNGANRALQLKPGDTLEAILDPQDPSRAVLQPATRSNGELCKIGYRPRYLRPDFLRESSAAITVERVNGPPAPLQFRVLCRATWPQGFKPFDTHDYEPIVYLPDATPTSGWFPSA